MKVLRIADMPEQEFRSPSGKYHTFDVDVSLELGGVKDKGTWGGGHPFDVQQTRVPPGATVCPLHAHSSQWEMFIILAGTATVRTVETDSGAETSTEAPAGSTFIHAPGTAHQIRNDGTDDLVFYVITDQPISDAIYYPDSDKWMIKPARKIGRLTNTSYFQGEED